MAGHNKWSKVKHIKGAIDAKRSQLFSKLSKEISLAARNGGDTDLNPRLRSAVTAARKQSMPSENIERAIKKGTGELGGAAIEEILYEGYGPGGVAFLIEVATDNKNRSPADIRTIFNKNNGNMGSAGSVAYLFDRMGEIRLPGSALGEDAMLEAALDAGAEDVTSDADEHIIHTTVENLFEVATALAKAGHESTSQKLVYVPKTTLAIADATVAAALIKLSDALDDYDDTQNVYSNFDFTDEVLAALDA